MLLGIATALAIFIAAAIALVCEGMHDDIGHADVALVLGNTVQLDGSPSPRLKARLDRTVELYQQGYFPLVIVSGGHGREGFDEGTVMMNYLSAHGIPERAIIVDNGGTTTYASAKNTADILRLKNLKSVLVVSQYFHLPRCKIALKGFGITPVYTAHAHYFEARDIYSTVREMFGCLEYQFRSYRDM